MRWPPEHSCLCCIVQQGLHPELNLAERLTWLQVYVSYLHLQLHMHHGLFIKEGIVKSLSTCVLLKLLADCIPVCGSTLVPFC